MKPITLKGGKITWVDDEDYEYLIQWRWGQATTNYAGRFDPKVKRVVLMHRVILDAPKGMQVDHIDGDRLMNVRSNLRLATSAENCRNRRPIKGTKTGIKGVLFEGGRWVARIVRREGRKCKTVFRGSFATAAEAIEARTAAVLELHGEFARQFN